MHFYGVSAASLLECTCAQDAGSISAKDPVLLPIVLMIRHSAPCVAGSGINRY